MPAAPLTPPPRYWEGEGTTNLGAGGLADPSVLFGGLTALGVVVGGGLYAVSSAFSGESAASSAELESLQAECDEAEDAAAQAMEAEKEKESILAGVQVQSHSTSSQPVWMCSPFSFSPTHRRNPTPTTVATQPIPFRPTQASLNAELEAVVEAKKMLEAAENKASLLKGEADAVGSEALDARQTAARAWIRSYKARTKLSGTIKIKA